MNLFRPGSLLAICAGLTAVAVPWAFSIWLRANDAFIGGLTMIGSSDGRPREIATGWLFVMTGLLAALAYAAPTGLALVLTRRLSTRTRNILVLGILPVALCFIWYGLTRRS